MLLSRLDNRATARTRSGARAASQLSFHALRRTATTLVHEAAIPQAVALALIGHDSAAVHGTYISVGHEAFVKATALFPDLVRLRRRRSREKDYPPSRKTK
jgi:integrase